MELAPAGVLLTFEVTYDSPSLHVGMSVYLDGSSPTLVLGPVTMLHVALNTYRARFGGTDGSSYIVVKAVYTDGSLTVVDTDYAQGSESIVVQTINGSGENNGGQGAIIGYVIPTPTLIGFVNC